MTIRIAARMAAIQPFLAMEVMERAFAMERAPAMEARLLTRLNVSEWREESLFETDLPRLVNSEQAPQFEF